MGQITRVIISFVVLLAIALQDSSTQETNSWGVLAGGSYSSHVASFSKLGSYPSCCPSFTDGDGYSLHGGAFYRIGLSSLFSIEGRLVAGGEQGTFLYNENTVVADIRDTLKVVRATFQHELDASLFSLGIEPVLAIRLTKGLDVLVGPRLSYNLQQSFTQRETLTQPEDYGAYLGSDRTWVATQAPIPNANSLRLALLSGLRVRLPQRPSSAMGIGFELTYTHGLTNVAQNVPWNLHQLRLSAVVTFARRPAQAPLIDTCLDCKQQSIAQQPARLSVPDSNGQLAQKQVLNQPSVAPNIEISAVSNGDTTRGDITIRERNRRIIVLHPLLGHVYFDEGASTIPLRFQRAIAKSRQDTMHLTPLEALQGELGIIAERMKSHPDAWLSIVGTTSNTAGDNGIKLARARAEEVRRTMNTLGIYDDRLRVSSRVFPERPTTFADSTTQSLAQEENRRVELSSNNPAIFAPIKLGSVEKIRHPEGIIIQGTISASADSSGFTLRVRRGDKLVAQRIIVRDSLNAPLEIDLSRDLDRSEGDSLVVEMRAMQQGLDKVLATRSVPIVSDLEERTRTSRSGDLEIERYGLILFDFDEMRISKQHERQLQFIRSQIRENTSVMVIGATDQIGSQSYNRELSLKRAKEVSRRLGVPNAQVVGNGEDNPALPNELPEGRAFNRTVVIQLATPVK